MRHLCDEQYPKSWRRLRIDYTIHRVRHSSTKCSAWGMLGSQAGNLDFSGTFAKLVRIVRKTSPMICPGRCNICKHPRSPSELQVVASLSGLCILRLLVCDALRGLGKETPRLRACSNRTLKPAQCDASLECQCTDAVTLKHHVHAALSPVLAPDFECYQCRSVERKTYDAYESEDLQ